MSDLSFWVERNADFTPDKTAIEFEGGAISYGQMLSKVRAFAGALAGTHGIKRGDRVAYLGYNSPELLYLYFACARLGAMLSPLNWRLAAPELAYILEDSDPSVVIFEPDFAVPIAEIRQQIKLCPAIEVSSFETADGDASDPEAGPSSPFLLVYTSGTTGRPKGAVLTQAAMQANALNCIHFSNLCATDRVLTVLPMFHVGGLNILTAPSFYVGATVILHRRFEPQATLDTIVRDRPDLCVLVPATLQALVDLPGWADADISSLRQITTGSMIVPPDLIKTVQARGLPVSQTYGLTETAPVAIYQKAEDAVRKPGAAGRCALHCEMRIIDDAGRDVAQGASGEILIKGPNVLIEYWRNPEETARAIEDGWFHTGDVGYEDEDGEVIVNDRKKDIVISGGENIYPAEIEHFVQQMDEVDDVAVVGRADPRWGEVPVAVICLKPGAALSEDAFLKRFEGKLARFKHPKAVVFLDALPKTALGKTQKEAVRQLIAG